MRLLHVLVIAALVLSAAYVYKIKFDATLQAERVAKLRNEIRRERDAVAVLRAEWARLDNPARIKALSERNLPLRQIEAHQIDALDRLPGRPPQIVKPGNDDPIGAMIESTDSEFPTGTVTPKGKR
jgi:hypothetical protein